MTFFSQTEAETEALGERLSHSLPSGGVVIAMFGELGAGKTAFIRGLARGLGCGAALALSEQLPLERLALIDPAPALAFRWKESRRGRAV